MFAKLGLACISVVMLALMVAVETEASWLKQRNVQWQGGMAAVPQHQIRNIKKTFLPPRYQNLWGQGESSKVIGSSALAPQNMEDYKMQSQQRQVFSWQPTNNVFNEW